VRCEATVIYTGSRTATAEARVLGADGKIYAHGTTTCVLVEPDRGGGGAG
jgi:acyl-coenzyme A thioesterase PaaI-like protein